MFRSGVYACLPSSNGNVEVSCALLYSNLVLNISPSQTSPLFQLQVLFAFLQNSSQGVYNPEALVSSLKLDKAEQQDVQEFSKLFMSLLDHEFKKQGERAAVEGTTDVSKLVQNLVSPTTSVIEWPLIVVAVRGSNHVRDRVPYVPHAVRATLVLPRTGSESGGEWRRRWKGGPALISFVRSQKGCSLEDRISESLRDEPMTGDNQ